MLAWYAMQRYDESDLFLSDILADVDREHQLSAPERGLAVDIASGTVRRRRTIDILLQALISRPRANVEADLWRLLQLGVYQIAFARTPDHAAVDATVELARMAGYSRWCGFANGVLRSAVRLVTEEQTDIPAPDSLPIAVNEFRRLSQSVFADPDTELTEYTGQAFSLPRALARRWSDRMSRAELMKASFYSLELPQTVLRVNRLAATPRQVQTALEEAGVSVVPGSREYSLRVGRVPRLTSLPGFEEGWWSVQDESAMSASELLNPQPDEKILDLCAAPGGKSTHMAELAQDQAEITACDVSEYRLARVEENVNRLRLSSVKPVLIDRDGTSIPTGPYDAVLVDVPCSNTGVLSRRPEARWRFRELELEELVRLQTRLLLTALDHVHPGGRIVYSTCSIEPEETSTLIRDVCQAVSGLSVHEQNLQLPGHPSDGAFQALLSPG